MKKNLYSICCVFLLLSYPALSQTEGFHYKAPIDKVPVDGFYNIVLNSEINAHVKTDYSDLRIVNDSGRWVPHLVWVPNVEVAVDNILYHRKIIRQSEINHVTELVIECGDSAISNFIIEIKNTVAERYCTLTGSDNLTNWYIINDSISITPEKSSSEKKSSFTISFPPVTYRYFKIEIKNEGRPPLNILNISSDVIPGITGRIKYYPFVENPSRIVNQKDSGKNSYILVTQKAPYHFEKIAFKVSGVKYYNRTADLYIPASSNHSRAYPGTFIQSFNISNNSTLEFTVPICNAAVFYVIIHNADNLPLKVDQVKTFTNYKVATVYLEKSKTYQLISGNASAVIPNYDISLNDIHSKQSLPTVATGNISALPVMTNQNPAKKDDSKKLIWFTIGIAAVVLSFFTYKLVREMGNNKS